MFNVRESTVLRKPSSAWGHVGQQDQTVIEMQRLKERARVFT